MTWNWWMKPDETDIFSPKQIVTLPQIINSRCLLSTFWIFFLANHWNRLKNYSAIILSVLYSTANDPQPQMIPRPQMIPKMDRKWSETASDPQKWPQMIPWKLEEWTGFYGTDYKKGLIIKKNFFLAPSKEKGKEDATCQVNLYKAKKKK